MNQAALDLDLDFDLDMQPGTAAAASAKAACPVNLDGSADRAGFEIGWDHAQRGLVPPAELLLNGSPVCQGWLAGKAVFGRRVLGSSRATRCWLALRITAWRQGVHFESLQLTPHYLAQIQATHCPVLRTPLGGAPGDADAAVIDRINPLAGYAAGNLAVLSQRVASARQGVDSREALRRANRIDAGAEPLSVSPQGLDAAAWRRVAALQAFATPLAFHDAAGLPLALLPPNRVRVLNAAQGLQALLTLQFVAPGWAARTRAIGALLPEQSLRQDFNLFIGALAPRVLEAMAHHGMPLRQVLEDAWLNERVQRRWQHFVLSLGEAATIDLLERATAKGLAGVRTLNHGPEQAVEGWGLTPDTHAAVTAAGANDSQRPRFTPAWRQRPSQPSRAAH